MLLHPIHTVCLKSSAESDSRLIFETESSFICIGILNLECAVVPPSSNNAAMPEVAVAIAIEH